MLNVLLVDTQLGLSPDAIDRLRSDRVALHHVTQVNAAVRVVDEAALDLVVVVLPADAVAIAPLVELMTRWMSHPRPRPLLVTSAAALERQPPALFGPGEQLPPRRLARSRSDDAQSSPSFHGIVGRAPATVRLAQRIERVAPSDRPVLVVGPTGSGKELVVGAIHRLGLHPDAPLLDLNCAAIPDALMESLLFGHVRGAFTGADAPQDGYLGAVGRGTLFLDEIAELPLLLQAKLLRVLETRRYRRVGSTEERSFKGRVVAATHADLRERCAERRFREDLYYRLAVLGVEVPPLAERRDDIVPLVEHFARDQPRPLHFSPAALVYLQQLDWPGNIRQLRNTVDRLAVMLDADPIDLADLREHLRGAQTEGLVADLGGALLRLGGGDKLAAAEQLLIDAAMREHGGNKSAAARALGVHRKVLERRLQRDTLVDDELDVD